MKDSPSKVHAKRLVLLFWIMISIPYFLVSYEYISVSSNDKKFQEYLEHVVQLAGNESRTPKEVRALVLVRADELGIPVTGDRVTILGSGHTLTITVGYEVDFDVPLLKKAFYTKHFDHQVAYKQRVN